jgi:hypothetical protein
MLVLEMGIKTLEEYWKDTVAIYKRHHFLLINEFVILKVLRQIAETLQEVHERGNVRYSIREVTKVLNKGLGKSWILNTRAIPISLHF